MLNHAWSWHWYIFPLYTYPNALPLGLKIAALIVTSPLSYLLNVSYLACGRYWLFPFPSPSRSGYKSLFHSLLQTSAIPQRTSKERKQNE